MKWDETVNWGLLILSLTVVIISSRGCAIKNSELTTQENLSRIELQKQAVAKGCVVIIGSKPQ